MKIMGESDRLCADLDMHRAMLKAIADWKMGILNKVTQTEEQLNRELDALFFDNHKRSVVQFQNDLTQIRLWMQQARAQQSPVSWLNIFSVMQKRMRSIPTTTNVFLSLQVNDENPFKCKVFNAYNWDDRPVRVFMNTNLSSYCRGIAVTKDGCTLLSLLDTMIYVFDIKTKTLIHKANFEEDVSAFRLDEQDVIWISCETSIFLHTMNDDRTINMRHIQRYPISALSQVRGMCFESSGKYIYLSKNCSTVCCYSRNIAENDITLPKVFDAENTMSDKDIFNDIVVCSSEVFVAESDRKRICVFDKLTGKHIQTIATVGTVTGLCAYQDTYLLACIGSNIAVYNPTIGKFVYTTPTVKTPRRMCVSHTGDIFVAFVDGSVGIF